MPCGTLAPRRAGDGPRRAACSATRAGSTYATMSPPLGAPAGPMSIPAKPARPPRSFLRRLYARGGRECAARWADMILLPRRHQGPRNSHSRRNTAPQLNDAGRCPGRSAVAAPVLVHGETEWFDRPREGRKFSTADRPEAGCWPRPSHLLGVGLSTIKTGEGGEGRRRQAQIKASPARRSQLRQVARGAGHQFAEAVAQAARECCRNADIDRRT